MALARQNPNKILTPVICPTRDYQGAVAQSIVTIWNALWVMGREPAYVQYGAHGYAFVRSGCFGSLREQFSVDSIRGLMIDDDILISDQQALIDAIRLADRYNWNFVAPYRVRDGYTTIANEDGQLLTVEEVSQIEPWDHVARAGLGFYYGDLPLTYKFHENGPHGGEDLNFWADNPQLKPRMVDLGLIHLKVFPLSMTTQLGPVPPRKEINKEYAAKYFNPANKLNGSALESATNGVSGNSGDSSPERPIGESSGTSNAYPASQGGIRDVALASVDWKLTSPEREEVQELPKLPVQGS